jgi:hypothetical protein
VYHQEHRPHVSIADRLHWPEILHAQLLLIVFVYTICICCMRRRRRRHTFAKSITYQAKALLLSESNDESPKLIVSPLVSLFAEL